MSNSSYTGGPALPPKDKSISGDLRRKSEGNLRSKTAPIPASSEKSLDDIPPYTTPEKISKARPKSATSAVQVCVRVRPVVASEALKKDNAFCLDTAKLTNSIKVRNKNDNRPSRDFAYDKVFGINDHQSEVYETIVRDLICRCLEGYNGCIFAYGQTGSGKTYTMQGPQQPAPDQYGIIQRVALQIIDHIETQRKRDKNVDFVLKVGSLEIYNEKLIDLLAGESHQSDLKIRQDRDGSGLYVQGLTERGVSTLQELMTVQEAGAMNRTVAKTNMNEASSRSHAIMTISIVEQREDPRTRTVLKKTSKINIVDLAGSERADASGATGQRLKEGSAINVSLSALGNVINALTKPGEYSHIPYRDSKLTYLLSDSLGGNSLTLMIACVSPTLSNIDETVSTLRFAERVKTVKNHAKVNMDPMMLRILELEAELAALKKRMKACTCGAAQLEDTSYCSHLHFRMATFFRDISVKIKKVTTSRKVKPEGTETKQKQVDKKADKPFIKATKPLD